MSIVDKSELIKTTKEWLQISCDKAIIGMSGGADSTLTAILAREALCKTNVITVHMPYDMTDENIYNLRSWRIAYYLDILQVWSPVGDLANLIVASTYKPLHKFSKEFTSRNLGNAKARARMTRLYDIPDALLLSF